MVKLASAVEMASKPATNAATGAAPAPQPSRRLGQGQPGMLRRKLNSDYEAWKQDQLKKTASWRDAVQQGISGASGVVDQLKQKGKDLYQGAKDAVSYKPEEVSEDYYYDQNGQLVHRKKVTGAGRFLRPSYEVTNTVGQPGAPAQPVQPAQPAPVQRETYYDQNGQLVQKKKGLGVGRFFRPSYEITNTSGPATQPAQPARR